MLRKRVLDVTQLAYQKDALQRVVADHQILQDSLLGINYLVFITNSLKPKAVATNPKPVRRDPFARKNIESDLFVERIHDTHNLLLNKYNVVDEHAVLATIDFEPQESRLHVADFKAMWTCMKGMDAFAFYNCGYASGASQPHKHMQLISYPAMQEYTSTKMPPLLQLMGDTIRKSIDSKKKTSFQLKEFPFYHLLRRIDLSADADDRNTAEYLQHQYLDMCGEILADSALLKSSLTPTDNATEKDIEDLTTYNLILTADFMFIVPRRTQSYLGIEVNSIGFTGSFLVQNQAQFEFLTGSSIDGMSGPMKLLTAVTFCR